MNLFVMRLIALAVVLVSSGWMELMAQPVTGNPPPPPPCWPPPCVPIDGGIGWLVAAGLIYGGKKIYDARKDNAPAE